MTSDPRPPAIKRHRSQPHTLTPDTEEHMARPESRNAHMETQTTRPAGARQPHPGGVMRATTLWSSFGYAFAGLRYLFWTQRNAKIHLAIGVIAIAFGVGFGIDQSEWLALVLAITLVLAAEGANTVIEALVDLASPGFHPLAKIAKDVAAGTVLLTAVAAALVGCIIFLPRLIALFWF